MQQLEIAILVAVAFFAGVAVVLVLKRSTRSTEQPPVETSSAPLVDRTPAAAPDREMSSLFDQLEVGVVWLDEELSVIRANRAASRLLQVEVDWLTGRSLMEMFLDHHVEETARVAAIQGSASLETTQRGDDGRRLLIRFRSVPNDGMWLFLDDVTELRRLQRIRSEFIDNLSHELRTPLTTIRLLTETLSADLDRPDVEIPQRIRDRVQKIDVETGHLVQMVNELLDLSRIEGGAAELHFDNVRIPEIIRAAIDRLRTFADRQRVGLEVEIPNEGMPMAWGDEERLGQVLVNLLHNAVKFAPPETAVTVGAAVVDGQIAITVRDQGPGIPRQDLDRIFERFYKVDKARERGQGGTGLGLSIARHIVEGHGGRIWAESDEGKGATFTFTVPIATRVAEAPPA